MTGNGRAALEHRKNGIGRVETTCRSLSDKTPSVPDMSHCPNQQFSKPWYEWNTDATAAVLDGIAELASCQKDNLESAIREYDENKKSEEHGSDSSSEFSVFKNLINWKVHGEATTKAVTWTGKAVLVLLFLWMLSDQVETKTLIQKYIGTHPERLTNSIVINR